MWDEKKAKGHVLSKLGDMLLNAAVAAYIGSIFAPNYLLLSLSVALISMCFGCAIHYIIGGRQ